MIRNIVPVAFNVLVRLVQNIVIFVLLARYLDPERFAFLALVFSIIFMISGMLDFGLRLRIGVEFNEILKRHDVFMSNWLAIKFLGFSIFVFLILIYGMFASYTLKEISFFLGATLSGFCLSISLFFSYFMSANERYTPELGLNCWYLLGSCMSLVLLFSTDSDLIYLLTLIITNVIGVVIGSALFKQSFSLTRVKLSLLDSKTMLSELKVTSPYFLHLFFTIFIGYFDLILMEMLTTRLILADYQILTRIILGLSLPVVVISIILPPRLRISENPRVAGMYSQFILVASFLLICGLYTFYDHQIISLVFTEKFSHLSEFSTLIMVVLALKYLQIVPGTFVTFYVSQKIRAKSILFAAVVMVAGFILLTPSYGLIGALISLIASNFFLLLLYVRFSINSKLLRIFP